MSAASQSARRRQLVAGTSLGAGLALVALLVVMLNYFGWKYHQRFDWTAGRFYSLSEKSRSVVDGLEDDVRAIVFMTPSSELFTPTTELLARYEAASPRFSVRVLDPQRNPAEARALIEQYDVASLNSVVIEAKGDRRVIEEVDLADYDYGAMQLGQGPQITDFKGEQLITGAILELLEERKPKILFLSGHGEVSLDDASARGLTQASASLGRDNFALESWTALGAAEVPDGTDLVVVAGPQVALLPNEVELLRRYAGGGGRLLLLLDPLLGDAGIAATGLEEWLQMLGVALGDDVIVEPENPLPFYSAETFFAADYADHPVTDALEQANYPVVFSLARSVDIEGGSETVDDALTLIHTSAGAWGERQLDDLSAVEKGDDDTPGPVGLAVALRLAAASAAALPEIEVLDHAEGAGDAEGPDGGETPSVDVTGTGEGEAADTFGDDDPAAESSGAGDSAAKKAGRMLIFGDADFATNSQLASVGNATLLHNAVNWLVERENLLAIAPREANQVQLSLSQPQMSMIYWLVLLLMPSAALVAAIGVYVRRRR